MKDLKIERPDWSEAHNLNDVGCIEIPQYKFTEWFDKHVQPLNDLLTNGVEVTGIADDGFRFKNNPDEYSTHKALLINIQPIQKETREEKLERILTDWVKCAPIAKLSRNEVQVFNEAKAALANEGQE